MGKADEMKRKNKVYSVEGDPDYGCIYIAAKNGKEAKQIALGTWVADFLDNPFIELRVLRRWSVKETKYEGELNISQINELGLAWWACPNCDKEDFTILSEYEYQCKNCKGIFGVPYVN